MVVKKALLSLSLLLITAHTCTIEVTNQAIAQQALNTSQAVIMFSTPTCGPCEKVKPMYESMSYPSVALYYASFGANIRAADELARQFNIRSFPTFLFLRNGQEVDRLIAGTENFQSRFAGKINSVFTTSGPTVTQKRERPATTTVPYQPKQKRQRRTSRRSRRARHTKKKKSMCACRTGCQCKKDPSMKGNCACGPECAC